MKLIIKISIILIFYFSGSLSAQETGEPIPDFNPDTVFVFDSPRELVSIAPSKQIFNNSAGFHVLISGSGFGFGGFYTLKLTKDLEAFASIYVSGARNSDEFEYYDPNTGELIIPGKKNRLYVIPVMFGLQYYIFKDVLDETFQPYLEVGLGPSFILANSYLREFFSALGYTQFNTRFGSFIGGGANIMSNNKSVMGVDIRYYHIPYGGDGLESIEGLPIYNFGGIFLALNIGWKF